MAFVFIEARNVRILEEVACTPHPRLNVVFGQNASGKSSLLEAIGFLSLGRSFRTAQADPVIRRGTDGLSVFGRYVEAGVEHRVGIERTRVGHRIKIDQNAGATVADLAHTVPLQAVTPDAHRLFFQDTQMRRQALAWSLFHVEPQFLPRWRAYTRLLKQRNAALRSGSAFSAWDRELAAAGEALSMLYAGHVTLLAPYFARFSENLAGLIPALQYERGWAAEGSLESVLAQDKGRDQQRGYTHAGPHRADVVLRLDGHAARVHASHGQQKLLLLAFRFAQAALLHELRHRPCVILIDDLPTDLDKGHRRDVVEALGQLEAQAFVTTTERELLPDTTGAAVFHVEQGRVAAVS